MRRFIIGTDWWTDCDDAVAMRLLLRAHKEKRICICGIVINACDDDSVRSLDGFLSSEGVYDIPIGIDRDATDYGGKLTYHKRLSECATRYTSNEDAEDAVQLYKRILRDATEPIEMLEIGFLQCVAALLESPDGFELVEKKVKKIWVMAGKWDGDGEKEHNFEKTPRSRRGGSVFCELFPSDVTFLGYEVGYGVITGDRLSDGDVLHDVLCDHGSQNGRHSWDPMLALLALTGDEESAGYTVVRGKANVDALDGANHFKTDVNGRHTYVVKAREDDFYREKINELIK